MAQQEEGWPLGLQPLNMRVGLIRNHNFSGSISFNTIITGSSSSSDSSSDLDTESTGSFFHEKSITLGNLIGVSTPLGGHARFTRTTKTEIDPTSKNNHRPKPWFFLCARPRLDCEHSKNPPSLAQFLEAERRAANLYKRDRNPIGFELDGYPENPLLVEANSLFMDGQVAAPRRAAGSPMILVGGLQKPEPWFGSDVRKRPTRPATICSCVCGLSNH